MLEDSVKTPVKKLLKKQEKKVSRKGVNRKGVINKNSCCYHSLVKWDSQNR